MQLKNMAYSHQKGSQRRLGRGIAMMSLKCQSEELSIDGKGTREPWGRFRAGEGGSQTF